MTKIYSIYDRVSKFYYLPMYSSSDEALIRDLSLSLRSFPKDHPIIASSKDFDVYSLGEFYEDAVEIQPIQTYKSPQFVFHISDLGGFDHA